MREVIPNSAAVTLALSGSRYVDVAAMPWSESVPGMRMKVLYKDDQAKEAMMLVEAGPGAVIPEHVHGGVNGR
jgi:quercetin dioxygenase-like cupin family protein